MQFSKDPMINPKRKIIIEKNKPNIIINYTIPSNEKARFFRDFFFSLIKDYF